MEILFDANYPKNLIEALQAIHLLDTKQTYSICWDRDVNFEETKNPVVLILDRKSRGIEITTKKHYDIGCKVFAMKLKKKQKMNPYDFSLTVLTLWNQIIATIEKESSPFVYTYKYRGKKLYKKMA